MRTILLSLLLLINMSFPGLVTGQPMVLTLTAHTTNLIVGEPVLLDSTVLHHSDNDILVHLQSGPNYYNNVSLGYVTVSFNNMGYSVWSDYLRPSAKVAPVKIQSKKQHLTLFTVLYSQRNSYVTITNAIISYRVHYAIDSRDGIGTPPVSCVYKMPVGFDSDVWKLLADDKYYGILIQTPWDNTIPQKSLDRFTAILKRYPKCTYSPYLALFLGRHYSERAQQNLPKSVELLSMVSQLTTNRVLIERAKIVLLSIESLAQPKRSDPSELLLKAVQTLESERYDVIGWQNSRTPEQMEYGKKSLECFEQAYRGTITMDENYRQQAELLTNYVRKYWKPLSPEEWKKQQEKYAAERRQKQAEDAADQRKLVEELERRKKP